MLTRDPFSDTSYELESSDTLSECYVLSSPATCSEYSNHLKSDIALS